MISKPCHSSSLWLTYCTYCSLILACFVSLTSLADELKITPNTCAVTLEKPDCHLDLLIEYQSDIPQSLCVWLTTEAVALTCFEDSLNFKYQVQLTLAKDALFELRDPQSNHIVTTALVKVAKFEPANPRRRRGLNWNLL
ncbi:DUF3019 domain-containing protein [Shewanella seohaensis]|uniref:DUF3019 domain-containing protein n=1 Tax=Shewanella seohaensis TaxID=755175 RepID=UPI00200E0E5E|nr:DUF3019 domain-containing protein [Shewanella seohaensis]MCL1120444.1 DUF3019 domain-containing protein [Shewanella seohaensis]UXM83217.1 DUF3019 domain-containing protein [Shewanella seohaensis]